MVEMSGLKIESLKELLDYYNHQGKTYTRINEEYTEGLKFIQVQMDRIKNPHALTEKMYTEFKRHDLFYIDPNRVSKSGLYVDPVPATFDRLLRESLKPLVIRVFNHIIPHLYREYADFRDFLGVTVDQMQVSVCADESPPFPVRYFGFDFIGSYNDGPVIIDYNTDRAMIAGFQNEIKGIFADVLPQVVKDKGVGIRVANFSLDLLNELVVLSGKKDPTILCLVDSAGDPYENSGHANFVKYAREQLAPAGGSAYLSDGSDTYFNEDGLFIKNGSDRKVDVVYKALKSERLLRNLGLYEPILEAARTGKVSMVNKLESYLVGNKVNMFLLTTNPVYKEYLQENLHESREVSDMMVSLLEKVFLGVNMVRDKKVYSVEKVEDFNHYLAIHRKNLIIKMGFSAGGRQVFDLGRLRSWQRQILTELVYGNKTRALKIAKDHHSRDWIRIVSDRNAFGAWAIQQQVEHDSVERCYVFNDDGGVIEETGLRSLRRVYFCTSSEEMVYELFARDSWKVNASGYTFPSGVFHGRK